MSYWIGNLVLFRQEIVTVVTARFPFTRTI
jgi:hypothetical protein